MDSVFAAVEPSVADSLVVGALAGGPPGLGPPPFPPGPPPFPPPPPEVGGTAGNCGPTSHFTRTWNFAMGIL